MTTARSRTARDSALTTSHSLDIWTRISSVSSYVQFDESLDMDKRPGLRLSYFDIDSLRSAVPTRFCVSSFSSLAEVKCKRDPASMAKALRNCSGYPGYGSLPDSETEHISCDMTHDGSWSGCEPEEFSWLFESSSSKTYSEAGTLKPSSKSLDSWQISPSSAALWTFPSKENMTSGISPYRHLCSDAVSCSILLKAFILFGSTNISSSLSISTV